MASQKQKPPSVPAKFTGRGGKQRLLAAICEQFIVAGNAAVASLLLPKCEVKGFQSGDDLMTQGGEDTHLMLILGGSANIMLNGRPMATRAAGQHVGEMALLDPCAVRSATVKASEQTVVAIVSEYDFNKIAHKHPQLWRRLALSIGERLRERSKFHPPMRENSAIFIASSLEGLPLAECIHASLKRSPLVPRLWSQGVFEAGKTTIEQLVRETNESDFAIIITSPDDVTLSRKKRKFSPRDNIIFELGLFMGALSRDRTFLLAPRGVDLKIPSDLLGLTLIPYTKKRGAKPSTVLREPLKALRGLIKKYGPR
jgi:CRP/FNR family transcriptional regulator, cyclic AMP receptor protein